MAVRTVFMGSDPIAIPLLDSLTGLPDLDLHAVFTQPDRPRGRGMKLQANAIKEWATAHGIPVHQPERCTKDHALWCQAQGVELILVMAYGQILRNSMLKVAPLGILNFHASILPAYRGASPIETAIACGESETGVSLMRIVRELDAGPVMDVEKVAITDTMIAAELRTELAAACVPLWQRCWPKIASGTAAFIEQDKSQVSFCRILTKEDAWLDFRKPATALAHRIRAFHFWPGCCFGVAGTVYKIGAARAEAAEATGLAPGTMICGKNRLHIACGDGLLEILQLQKPGGRMLPIADFLCGHRFLPGACADLVSSPDLVSRPQ